MYVPPNGKYIKIHNPLIIIVNSVIADLSPNYYATKQTYHAMI